MQGMPQPTQPHKQLERLAGIWKGDERLGPSPWGPGGPATGRMNARMDLDGFFLIQDYVQEKDGKATYRGHGVLGWDAPRGLYAWFWVDSLGMIPHALSYGTFEGNSLVLRQDTPGMGFSRYTFALEGEAGYRLRIEISNDGHAWTTFLEGDYRRA